MAMIRTPRKHRDGYYTIFEESDEDTNICRPLCDCTTHATTEDAWTCLGDGRSEALAASAFGKWMRTREELKAMTQEAHALLVVLKKYDLQLGLGPRERPALWAEAFRKSQALSERVARVLANTERSDLRE